MRRGARGGGAQAAAAAPHAPPRSPPRRAHRHAAALLLAAALLAAAALPACARQPQMLSPLLGLSREGTTVTFRTAADVAWTVLHDGGSGEYDTLERTSTSLTLRAGHAGGGKYSVVAKLDTPACATAPAVPGASSSKCVFSAVWHIMWPWQVRSCVLRRPRWVCLRRGPCGEALAQRVARRKRRQWSAWPRGR
jgi:hypothetical protein